MESKSSSSDSPIGLGQLRHSTRFTSSDDSPSTLNNMNLTKKRLTIQKKPNSNPNNDPNATLLAATNSNGKLNRSFTSLTLSSSSSKRQHTNSSSTSSHITSHGHSRSKPAELYRTDFITAMKIPDTEVTIH